MGRDETTQPTIIDQLRQRKGYLSTTEVMAILGVTRGTIWVWDRSGSLGAIRIGKDRSKPGEAP
jgi:predicted DNA-binding transcriptional regulator AlpA